MERLLRAIAAIVFSSLYFSQIIPDTIGLPFLILGVALLFTATIGMSLFYRFMNQAAEKEENVKAQATK